VINTVKPEFFKVEIQKALLERKEKQALTHNRYIEMKQTMLSLITNSHHVSTATRGKALSLLNTTSKKRGRDHFEYTHSSFQGVEPTLMGNGRQDTTMDAQQVNMHHMPSKKEKANRRKTMGLSELSQM
jgi:hypothetical protein